MNRSLASASACTVRCRRAMLAVLLLGLAGEGQLIAQNQPPGAGKGSPTADLERVPADAALLISVRVAELWNSEPIKAMRQQQGRELAEGAKAFEKEIGVTPGDMERVSIVMSDFHALVPLIFVTTVQPFDRAKIMSTALTGVKPARQKEQIYFVSDKNQAIVFLSDRTYLISSADAVRAYLDRPAAREGALSPALQLAGQDHQIVGCLNVSAFAQQNGGKLPPQLEAFKDLLKARTAIGILDLGQNNKLDLRLNFADESEAKRAEKPLQAAIDLARVGLALAGQQTAPQPGGPGLQSMLKLVNDALQTAKIAQKGADLQVTVRIQADVPVVVATVVSGVQQVRQSANRMQSINDLKQIALAMHNYQDSYGHFPAQAIYSKDGKPLLSWRVSLLPFLDQDALYKQFKLDEAWDSPHNQRLLAQMPKVFADPNLPSGETVTVFEGFVGPGAVFEGTKGLRLPADFPDGTSNTIMLVEAANPVPWTKPEDLPYDPNKPLPKLGGHASGGFSAAFCDGSVRFLRQNIKESILRALITRNGGEVIDPKSY
ncbi:MAG TPA: DUF1559 domain-containing protein [Gemmataceae bacterium]|nr:DUF1559 domain-containing protein [Gemmataceae bacterium]